MALHLILLLLLLIVSSKMKGQQSISAISVRDSISVLDSLRGSWRAKFHYNTLSYNVSNKLIHHVNTRKIIFKKDKIQILEFEYENPKVAFEVLNSDTAILENYGLRKRLLNVSKDSLLGIVVSSNTSHSPDIGLFYDGKNIFLNRDQIIYRFTKRVGIKSNLFPSIQLGIIADAWQNVRPHSRLQIHGEVKWFVPSSKNFKWFKYIEFKTQRIPYGYKLDSLFPGNLTPQGIQLSDQQRLGNYQYSFTTSELKLNIRDVYKDGKENWLNIGYQWNRTQAKLPRGFNPIPLLYNQHSLFLESGVEIVNKPEYAFGIMLNLYWQNSVTKNYRLVGADQYLAEPSMFLNFPGLLGAKRDLCFRMKGLTKLGTSTAIVCVEAKIIQNFSTKTFFTAIGNGAVDGFYWIGRQIY